MVQHIIVKICILLSTKAIILVHPLYKMELQEYIPYDDIPSILGFPEFSIPNVLEKKEGSTRTDKNMALYAIVNIKKILKNEEYWWKCKKEINSKRILPHGMKHL